MHKDTELVNSRTVIWIQACLSALSMSLLCIFPQLLIVLNVGLLVYVSHKHKQCLKMCFLQLKDDIILFHTSLEFWIMINNVISCTLHKRKPKWLTQATLIIMQYSLLSVLWKGAIPNFRDLSIQLIYLWMYLYTQL